MISVVRGLEFTVDQVQSEVGRREINYFHSRIVETNDVSEQIEIAACEDDRIEQDALAGNAWMTRREDGSTNGTSLLYLPAQERVFQIFSSRIMIAAKWEKSPSRRKMFIFDQLNSMWMDRRVVTRLSRETERQRVARHQVQR